MPPQSKKWIFRAQKEDHILGPFEVQKIRELLIKGVLTGDELVAQYPGGDWMALSKEPELYDLVLESLSQETQRPAKPKLQAVPNSEGEKSEAIGTFSRGWQATKVVKQETAARTVPTGGHTSVVRPLVLETTEVPNSKKGRRKGAALLLLAAAAVLLYIGLTGTFSSNKTSSEGSARISLLQPAFAKTRDASMAQGAFNEGFAAYNMDTFTGYMKAQDRFVRSVEANSMNPEPLAMLLMTYLELWPFAKQDGQDQAAVQKVFEQLNKAAPFGIFKSIGAGAYNLILGHTAEARGVIDTALQGAPSEGRLYFLKGDLLFESGNFFEAQSYFEKARALLPAWNRPSYMMGVSAARRGDPAAAGKYFVETLNKSSRHAWARLELGLLQAQVFNQLDQARPSLTTALDSGEKFLPSSEGRARFWLALMHLKSGDVKRAREQALWAQKLVPADSDVRDLLEKLGGASTHLEAKTDEREYVALGDEYMQSKNFLAAQAQYKAALGANPRNGIAARKAAEALWNLHQSNEAIDYLKKAISIDPKDLSAFLLLANFQTQRYDFDAANQSLEAAQKINPKSYEVYRGYGEMQLKRGDVSAAEVYAMQALKLFDADARANELMSRVELAKKEVVKANQYAKKAVELDRLWPQAHVSYAKTISATQSSKQAADYLSNQINSYPTEIQYRMGLAEIYLSDEQYKAAQQVLSQVVQADEKNKDAFLLLGLTYFMNNQAEEALKNFLSAARIDPSDPEGLFRAGEVYLKANRPAEAKRQFDLVVRSNQKYPRVHYSLARAYQGLSEADLALKELELEKLYNPNLPESYELAGDLNYTAKRFDLATKEYQKASKLRGDGSAALYIKMARSYRYSGNYDAALAMLQLAARRESGLPEIYREQGAIFDLKGQVNEAISSYRQYLNLEPSAPDKENIQNRIKLLE